MNKIIIIGNSITGISAAETIRAQDKESRITIISDQETCAYHHSKLIDFLSSADESFDAYIYRDENFYKENDIDLILSNRVTKIDFEKKKVALAGKERFSYDKLLIASGKKFFVPKDLKGHRKANVFLLNSLSRMPEIRERVSLGGHVCTWGADYLAIQLALFAKSKGADVKMVSASKILLPGQANSYVSNFIEEFLNSKGIDVFLGRNVAEILGNGAVNSVRIDSGKVFAAENVLVTENFHPSIEFLKESILEIDQGILVNKRMKTSVEDIFAAGDVAQFKNCDYVSDAWGYGWDTCAKQGEVAAKNILGIDEKLSQESQVFDLEFMDLKVISQGDLNYSDGKEQICLRDAKNGFIFANFHNGRLVGFALVNSDLDKAQFSQWLKDQAEAPLVKQELFQKRAEAAALVVEKVEPVDLIATQTIEQEPMQEPIPQPVEEPVEEPMQEHAQEPLEASDNITSSTEDPLT